MIVPKTNAVKRKKLIWKIPNWLITKDIPSMATEIDTIENKYSENILTCEPLSFEINSLFVKKPTNDVWTSKINVDILWIDDIWNISSSDK